MGQSFGIVVRLPRQASVPGIWHGSTILLLARPAQSAVSYELEPSGSPMRPIAVALFLLSKYLYPRERRQDVAMGTRYLQQDTRRFVGPALRRSGLLSFS